MSEVKKVFDRSIKILGVTKVFYGVKNFQGVDKFLGRVDKNWGVKKFGAKQILGEELIREKSFGGLNIIFVG